MYKMTKIYFNVWMKITALVTPWELSENLASYAND